MKPIDIAVVDDHELWREGIVLVLNQIPEFRVLFDAPDGEAFLHQIEKQLPEVVLMDINMPRMDGVTATGLALSRYPDLRVIALTMFSDHLHYAQMTQAGARGFILKRSGKTELQRAVSAVIAGDVYVDSEILSRTTISEKSPTRDSLLTAREFDILRGVCRGLTSQEIAEQLCISSKTVEGHRANLLQKTAARNTAELIIWAIRHNLVTIE